MIICSYYSILNNKNNRYYHLTCFKSDFKELRNNIVLYKLTYSISDYNTIPLPSLLVISAGQ